MTFEEAKALLSNCCRDELRDHSFGDREIYFTDSDGNDVAEGYSGSSGTDLTVLQNTTFSGVEAVELCKLGTKVGVERNDSAGPDEYREGKCMPGLTVAGVLDELTQRK